MDVRLASQLFNSGGGFSTATGLPKCNSVASIRKSP
jgi:hypothetical protein